MRRLIVLLALFGTAAGAQGVGVAARVGSLGVGVGVSAPVHERVRVRVNAQALAFGQSGLLDAGDLGVDGLQLDYDADLGLGSVGVLVDWHPLGTTFRVTAGALVHGNGATARIRAAEPYYDASLDRTFSVERVGTLDLEVSYAQPVAPYVGIGVGDLAAGRLGVTAEIGLAYVGPPSIAMTGTGLIGGTAAPSNVAILEAGLDSFRFHPVGSIGLKTSFGR